MHSLKRKLHVASLFFIFLKKSQRNGRITPFYFQTDEYSVPQSIALHLAGLQAQVIHGEYEDDKLARYWCTNYENL